MQLKDNGEQEDRVDAIPETSTTKSSIKNEKNRTFSSATTKIVATLATHGVFGMPLLRSRGANDLVEGKEQRMVG